MLVDNQIDIPDAPVMGIHMKVEFEGKKVLYHFRCYVDDGYFLAVDPLIGLDISDLREACSIKPEDTYRWMVLHQAEAMSGMIEPPPNGISYPQIKSLADFRQRIVPAW